ncbi:hypothetical protein ACH47B_37155 [Rhodococcus sp. NPDC019627]|uniref:hypothetical protein n=1 Tax=unclassified Rhodococcus (in: high G+C Gram-positive bacteria) TaxID=192944 RepID=UPI0034073B4D
MSTPVLGSSRHRSPHPAPDTDTESRGEVEDDYPLRRPRHHHERRRIAWLRWQGMHELTAEAQDFVEYALEWAPYGGAPTEETFLRFGMTGARFTERLWQLVHDGQISAELSAVLTTSFPTPGQSQATSRPPRIRGAGNRQRTTRAATAR